MLSESVTYQSPSGTGVYTFTTNGIYVFNFTDLAGNTGSATVTVTWIDKTAPVLAQITVLVQQMILHLIIPLVLQKQELSRGSCTSATTTASIGNNKLSLSIPSLREYMAKLRHRRH